MRKRAVLRWIVALAVATLLFYACGRAHVPPAVASVFLDPVERQAVTVDIVCDYGGGSTGCTQDSLGELLRTLVPTLPAGSLLRLQGMTDSVLTEHELARYTITQSHKRTRRALEHHTEQDTNAVLTTFLPAAAPVFDHPDRHASPIAETIARSVIAGPLPRTAQHIYVLTDARQVSRSALGDLDFECGDLPSVDKFSDGLRELIAPSTFTGVAIHFAYVRLEPVENNRCTATLQQYVATRELWTKSLEKLGASVTWSMGPVQE